MAPAMRLMLFPILVSPFEKVRFVENEVIYPQMDARLALVVARAPERFVTFEFVVARLLLIVLRLVLVTVRLLLVTLRFPERLARVELVVARLVVLVLRLVVTLLRVFASVVILALSVERRSKIVEKILENAPCMLASSGAESNSIVP